MLAWYLLVGSCCWCLNCCLCLITTGATRDEGDGRGTIKEQHQENKDMALESEFFFFACDIDVRICDVDLYIVLYIAGIINEGFELSYSCDL